MNAETRSREMFDEGVLTARYDVLYCFLKKLIDLSKNNNKKKTKPSPSLCVARSQVGAELFSIIADEADAAPSAVRAEIHEVRLTVRRPAI